MSKKVNRVYIAGPYTKGDLNKNIRVAMEAAETVISMGFSPFIPHLYFFVELAGYTHGYETWMRIDQDFLYDCQICIRVPGESSGADREVAWCMKNGVPVYTLDEFRAAYSRGEFEYYDQGKVE